MKVATILHNPAAGEKGHSLEKLFTMLSDEGYKYYYTPVSESGMDEVDDDTEFLVIAGGDGTVRKVVKQLLLRDKTSRNVPIGLLPWGTANNIAKSLDLDLNDQTIISSWKRKKIRSIDLWNIKELPGARFFIEGMGFGVFPQLIKEMQEKDTMSDQPVEKKIQTALETLQKIIADYKAIRCRITADGTVYSGNYILVQLMNISSVGPNLQVAPQADSGDGLLEIVLVSEDQRQELENYIKNRLEGVKTQSSAFSLRAHNIEILCESDLVHVDDELLTLKEAKEIEIYLDSRSPRFLVP